jgi:hypothetical protein
MIHLRRATVGATDQRLEGQPAEVPVGQMTTYEIRDLRRTLEETLAMAETPPYTRPREHLEQMLTEVLAEQADRARIRREPYSADDA